MAETNRTHNRPHTNEHILWKNLSLPIYLRYGILLACATERTQTNSRTLYQMKYGARQTTQLKYFIFICLSRNSHLSSSRIRAHCPFCMVFFPLSFGPCSSDAGMNKNTHKFFLMCLFCLLSIALWAEIEDEQNCIRQSIRWYERTSKNAYAQCVKWHKDKKSKKKKVPSRMGRWQRVANVGKM